MSSVQPQGPEPDDGPAVAVRLREQVSVLAQLPTDRLSEHVDAYQGLYGQLQAALTDIDDA